MPDFLNRDLDTILERTVSLWNELRGGRLFITGGTGFTGRWLLESFLYANDCLDLGAQVVILTRDFAAFGQKAPQLAEHLAVQLWKGDVRDFPFPPGRFTHIIHAAAESDPRQYLDHPMRMLDTMLSGTRHMLDFALQCGTPKFLLVSSGMVYGRQPLEVAYLSEDYPGEPDVRDPFSVYGEGKRLSELLCMTYGHHYGLQVKIGRCFSSLGPFLPVGENEFIGRLIRDGLNDRPMWISELQSSRLSFLYAADLAVWLWTILVRGECYRAYNVGSEQAISIADLAQRIGQVFQPPREVCFFGCDQDPVESGTISRPPENYVPSTESARVELQLRQEIDLEEAVRRTVEWYRSCL